MCHNSKVKRNMKRVSAHHVYLSIRKEHGQQKAETCHFTKIIKSEFL